MRIHEILESVEQVYYHGSKSDEPFAEFSHQYTGVIGFHFTKNPNQAKDFGKYIVAAHLRMLNTAGREAWGEALAKSSGGNPRAMAVRYLKKQGYDSVETPYETIVFEPDQIHILSFSKA